MLSDKHTPIRILSRHQDMWPVSVADKRTGIYGTIDYSHASLHAADEEFGEFDLPIVDTAGHRHQLVWKLFGEFTTYVGLHEGTYATRVPYLLWSLPNLVRKQLPLMTQINTVHDLPADIADGRFLSPIAGRQYGRWELADPGAPWQVTDVIVTPHLPDRRLIFGACSPAVCILHYESGGIAKSAHLLALIRSKGKYKAVWHAVGGPPLDNINGLRQLLSGPLKGWHETTGTDTFY